MHSHHGSTFIEIIISMLLISLMLLGLDAMHLTAIREAKNDYYFSVAIQQLQNFSEILSEVNSDQFTAIVTEWNNENKELLPNGIGIITGQIPYVAIKILWGKATELNCNNKIGASGCVSLSSFD